MLLIQNGYVKTMAGPDIPGGSVLIGDDGKIIAVGADITAPENAQIIDAECKKAVKEAEAKWLKDRPRVQHGQYSGMTTEQIMSITDTAERVKAIAQNQHLF